MDATMAVVLRTSLGTTNATSPKSIAPKPTTPTYALGAMVYLYEGKVIQLRSW